MLLANAGPCLAYAGSCLAYAGSCLAYTGSCLAYAGSCPVIMPLSSQPMKASHILYIGSSCCFCSSFCSMSAKMEAALTWQALCQVFQERANVLFVSWLFNSPNKFASFSQHSNTCLIQGSWPGGDQCATKALWPGVSCIAIFRVVFFNCSFVTKPWLKPSGCLLHNQAKCKCVCVVCRRHQWRPSSTGTLGHLTGEETQSRA